MNVASFIFPLLFFFPQNLYAHNTTHPPSGKFRNIHLSCSAELYKHDGTLIKDVIIETALTEKNLTKDGIFRSDDFFITNSINVTITYAPDRKISSIAVFRPRKKTPKAVIFADSDKFGLTYTNRKDEELYISCEKYLADEKT
ncbi:MAG: hypothetical protein H6618_08980 [Deltaproteobacteria bacterium]|nr:hypothetical protein [Deltaproteobacteria bacterium]